MDLFRPHWEIFNPIYFSESQFNYSLGDLLFNVLSVFFVLAIFFRLCKWIRLGVFFGGREKLSDGLFLTVLPLLVLFSGFLAYRIPWIILEHSQIELDISQSISFDYMRVVASLILVIVALSFIIIFTLSQKIFQFIKQPLYVKIICYAVASVVFYWQVGNCRSLLLF